MLSYALVTANGDPYTYQETIESQDRERWVQAMSEEMQSLHQNQTWRLVQLPQGKRPIGCKWVYSRKDRVELVEALGHQGGDCYDPGGVPKAQGIKAKAKVHHS